MSLLRKYFTEEQLAQLLKNTPVFIGVDPDEYDKRKAAEAKAIKQKEIKVIIKK